MQRIDRTKTKAVIIEYGKVDSILALRRKHIDLLDAFISETSEDNRTQLFKDSILTLPFTTIFKLLYHSEELYCFAQKKQYLSLWLDKFSEFKTFYAPSQFFEPQTHIHILDLMLGRYFEANAAENNQLLSQVALLRQRLIACYANYSDEMRDSKLSAAPDAHELLQGLSALYDDESCTEMSERRMRDVIPELIGSQKQLLDDIKHEVTQFYTIAADYGSFAAIFHFNAIDISRLRRAAIEKSLQLNGEEIQLMQDRAASAIILHGAPGCWMMVETLKCLADYYDSKQNEAASKACYDELLTYLYLGRALFGLDKTSCLNAYNGRMYPRNNVLNVSPEEAISQLRREAMQRGCHYQLSLQKACFFARTYHADSQRKEQAMEQLPPKHQSLQKLSLKAWRLPT